MSLNDYRKQLTPHLISHGFYKQSVREEKRKLRETKRSVRTAERAQKIIQEVAAGVQEHAHKRIASVVTRCLQTVAREPYEFRIRFDQKRGKTDAVLTFVRDGIILDDPLDEAGGGMCDIAAFALRLACLVLSHPQRRRLIVLDEPFKNLKPAEYYGPRVAAMMLTLADELNVQFVIVQNLEDFQCGKVIHIGG